MQIVNGKGIKKLSVQNSDICCWLYVDIWYMFGVAAWGERERMK